MESKRNRLLLIEDDVIDQNAFQRFADQTEFPYDFDIAGSVKEAKQSLKSNRYDVILADYSLGDGTAFDILKVVRNTPIVIVTGTGEEEVAVQAMKLGAFDYLIKDVEGYYYTMMLVTLENAIKHFLNEQIVHEYHENLEQLVDDRTAELRKSEQKFRTLYDSTFDIILSISPEGNLTSWNKQAQKVFGYTDDEIIGKHVSILVPKELHNEQKEIIARVRDRGFVEGFESIRIAKDGTRIPVEMSVSIMADHAGNLIGLSGILRDITLRKRAEKIVKGQARLLDLIFEHSLDSIVLLDKDYNFIRVSETYAKACQRDSSEFLGLNHFELFPSNLKEEVDEAKRGKHIYQQSARPFIFPDHPEWGESYWDLGLVPILDEEGEIELFLFTLKDVTEQKQAEEELFLERNKLKVIMNAMDDGIYIVNKQFDIEYINPAIEREFGTVKGQKCYEYFHDRKEVCPWCKNKEVFNGKSVRWEWYSSKTKKTFDLFDTPIINADGSVSKLEVFHDITSLIKAQDELHQSLEREQSLADIVRYAPIGITYGYPDGSMENCNVAFSKLIGYSSKEIKDVTCSKLLTPDKWLVQEAKELAKLSITNKRVQYEKEYIHKDGQIIPVELVVTAKFDNEGSMLQYISFVIDITERKHTEQIQKVLYNISNAVIITDNLNKLIGLIRSELGSIIDTSNFYIALYDQKTDTLSLPFFADEKDKLTSFPAGKTLTKYVIETKKPLLADVDLKKRLVREGKLEHIGSLSKIWLGVPLKIEGKVIGIIAVQSYSDENAFNESDMKMLEFVSDQISTSIDRKKAEEDLTAALVKAEESDCLKSAFLANMSHEIRTPMNGILGFADMLKEPGLTSEEQQEYLAVIESSSERMLNIISNLMDISKIEAGQMGVSISETNINEQIEYLNTFFKPEVEQKEMQLFFMTPLSSQEAIINTDKEKVHVILTNLISNAIKYADEGSIEFGYKKNGNFFEFFVKDMGIGVPKDRQQSIFERFIQAEMSASRHYEGAGLGLSISKAYVELLGGKIWVESEEGKGSVFYFTIPV